MNKISLQKVIAIGLSCLITQISWAKELITPERLAEISIDSIQVSGEVIHRPCPQKFQSNCPAGVPSQCLLVIGPSLSGSITITNNSGITALNINIDQAFLNSLDVFQTPSGGIPSLAPHASATLNFIASGLPVNPPATIEVIGTNTAPACFSMQVLP